MQPSCEGHLEILCVTQHTLCMRMPKYIENVQELNPTGLNRASDLSTLPPAPISVSGSRAGHLEMVYEFGIFTWETEQVQQEVLCHTGGLTKPLPTV